MKVLIVEDHLATRQVLSISLKALYGLIVCDDSACALRALDRSVPDAVVTDLNCPEDGAGITVAKRAEELGVPSDHIIFLSSDPLPEGSPWQWVSKLDRLWLNKVESKLLSIGNPGG